MWHQEGTQERLGKMKLVKLTGFRETESLHPEGAAQGEGQESGLSQAGGEPRE